MNKNNEFDFIDISEGEKVSPQNEFEMDVILEDLSFDEETLTQANAEQPALNNQGINESFGNAPSETSQQQAQTPSVDNSGNMEKTPENTSETQQNPENSSSQETGSSENFSDSSRENSDDKKNDSAVDGNNNQDSQEESNENNQEGDEEPRGTKNKTPNKEKEKNPDEKKPAENKGDPKKQGDPNKNAEGQQDDKKDNEQNDQKNNEDKHENDPNKKTDDKSGNDINKKTDDKPKDSQANAKTDDKKNNDKKTDDKKSDGKQPSDRKNDSALDKKRQEEKEKSNRHKNTNPKDNKTAKPKGSGLKSKATNFAKNKATQALGNTETGQKVANAVEFAAKIKKINPLTIKIALIASVIAIVALLIYAAVNALLSSITPGTRGDVKDDYNYGKYTEVDRDTLEKMKKIFSESPNADLELAMATVLYPYYANLHGGNVTSYLGGLSEEDNFEEDIEEDEISSGDDDVEDENGEIDDIYLIPFRNSKVRNRLKKLLKNMGSRGDNATFESYVKDKYFKKDGGFSKHYNEEALTGYNGYKNMFDALANSSDEDMLKDAIIKDLYAIKDMFINYVYSNKYCSSSAVTENASSADTLYSEIMQGKIPYVNIKDTTAENFSSIKSAKSAYGTDVNPMELERYIMGVVYVEVGPGVVNDEARAKSFMIAAHSLLLGRTQSGKGINGHTGKKFTPDYTDDGKVIFYIRGNTYDQDFCDVYEGCQDGSNYGWDKREYDAGSGTPKPPVSEDGINRLKQWWAEIQNQYIYHSTEDFFAGSYSYNYTDYCKKGSCITVDGINGLDFTDYNELLFEYAYTDEGFSLYDSSSNSLASISVDCTGISSGNMCTISDDEFIYYSQKVGIYSNETFCGRSDGSTISKSGCGITSMAMVIANLADSSVTPLVTNEEAKAGGYCGDSISGTSAGYFSKAANTYGLTLTQGVKSSSTDLNAAATNIETTLMNGGLVIINVNPNWLGGSSGHYIVVKGITSEKKLIIADPYSNSLATSPHNLEFTALEILTSYVDNGHGWYMFTSDKSSDIVNKYCSNQVVGEAGVATGTLGYPVQGVTGCDDSDYPNYSNGNYHGGSDINKSTNGGMPVEGKAIYAADGGKVTAAQELSGSYGVHVKIDHGNGYTTLYAHMKSGSLKVKVGDIVSRGQQIGVLGNTGNSTGPHLHIEIRKNDNHNDTLNPCKYIGKNKKYAN